MNPTAPGVYLVEVPSGNRAIAGVATSVTAFVGRARRGPTDRAVRITHYGAFEKHFGGLWLESTMGHAVRQFYQNGGSDAVIVRLADTEGVAAEAPLANGTPAGLVLAEARPGSGGATLRVRVTDDAGTRQVEVEERLAAPNGQPVAVRSQRFSGADVPALRAAFDADDSLVTAAEFTALPGEADWADLAGGTGEAAPARGSLPVQGGVLRFEAAAAGADGNALAVTVLPSASSLDTFAVVLEELQEDGTYAELGRFPAVTVANVAATVNGAALAAEVAGDPALLPQRPLPARRRRLAGGAEGVAATLELPVEGMAFRAANEGSWGNRLRLRADRDTRDPADDSLFNLTVEELDADGRPVATEVLRNLSTDGASPRFAPTMLEQQSELVRTDGAPPGAAPLATGAEGVMLAGGTDGGELTQDAFIGAGLRNAKRGLFLLEDVDLFNLLVIPPLTRDIDVPEPLWTEALTYCRERRAVLIVDPPSGWNRPDQAVAGMAALAGLRSPNSVLYFPRVRAADPLRDNNLETFTASGTVAGIIARTDASIGVWKSPAGLEAGLVGVRAPAYNLIDGEVGQLNPLGVNCLQVRPAAGLVVWGARTLAGDDRLASEWKYLAVRRLALYIEESIYRGSQWAVFEPNDRPLWQQLRLSIGSFMNQLFRKGAFQGSSPAESFYVKCDEQTTTQADIDLGIVNVEVGFSPLKPAEFVIIRIRQMAGQVAA